MMLGHAGICQELKLGISSPPASGQVIIHYPSDKNAYFVIESTTNLPGLFKATGMALGTKGNATYPYSTLNAQNSFFKMMRIPLPLDLSNLPEADQDHDGIDDIYELQHPTLLNSFNPADGPANLAEYQSSFPLFAWFETSVSAVKVTDGTITLPVHLSRPFAGTLRYQISGTAVLGKDFQPLSGVISVNGTTAVLPISLITTPEVESARSIVITLQQQANSGFYSSSSPTALRLDVIEGDRGIYSGTMAFTNDVFIGAQSLRVAIRSTSESTGVAYFDTTGSTLFTQPFSMDVRFTGMNNQFQFTAPVAGTINTITNLGRNLNWKPSYGGRSDAGRREFQQFLCSRRRRNFLLERRKPRRLPRR